MKNKEIWKQLAITILSSKATKEAIKTLFKSPYIDIVSDQQYLSKIMDNIRFFIYDRNSNASTNRNSLRIYEFGLYNKEATISESLLSFYSFNIISNLHEICGHINIRVQNFNSNLLNNNLDSPRIDEKNSNLYSDYAKIRQKESGEAIEIALFGRNIKEITIKEALFILNPTNYASGLKYFNENFKKCNSKDFKDIVNNETIETYLKPLGIKYDELPKNINKTYKNNINIFRANEKNVYSRELGNHPPQFYYEIDKEFINYVLSHYKN